MGGLDKYEPRDGILRQTVSGGTAVIGYSVGQLECLYNTARRLRFDCENDWLIMLIGKSMRLPNLPLRFLLAEAGDVSGPYLHRTRVALFKGKCLSKLHAVMKRRTSPRLGREFFFWADNGQSGSYRATSRGKMVAKADAPDPKAIPWLLVTVTGHSGSGKLSGVTSIQRVNTVGGLAPTAQECTAQSGEVEFKSSYSADYYFYARRA